MENELQGHMRSQDGTKALCGNKDAYIIDVEFHTDPDEDRDDGPEYSRGPQYWGVTCDNCNTKIRKLAEKQVALQGHA